MCVSVREDLCVCVQVFNMYVSVWAYVSVCAFIHCVCTCEPVPARTPVRALAC